ncbi:MAG: hypothetical protein OEU26_07225 [Candidatus Tectomicrobia bacterium]|nr:hypothetical protein [Candidatus Tectomicrobia bacterium]
MPVAYMSDEVVVKEAQRRLQAHLPINWEGNQYNPTHAWTVLIGRDFLGVV